MKTRLELLRTVLWLRWRLSRNQLRRTGVFAQILLVLVVILALGGVFGAGATGLLLGLVVFPEVGVEKVMYVIDGVMVGFLFMWIIGLVVDVQRSEAVDLQRLLHLPVTLKDAFLVNFAASHITVSLGLAVPAVFGLALGLALATDLRWLLLVPLFLAFVFLVSTWTYCVRGWLVQLMVNPRRRRAIIILLTAAIVVLAQAPNLFFNVYLRRSVGNREEAAQVWKEQLEVIERAHLYVPPLWVGWGTVQATRGVWWPALGAMALFGAGGVLGFRRAYQSTLRYYRGQERRRKSSERKPAASSERADRPSRREFIERRLPFVSSEVSVATLAFWRSMQRAPEMKMALLTPLLMLGIFGVMLYSRDFGEGPRRFGPLIAISLTAFALSGLTGILFNQFGSDRNGFRALVLSPVRRQDLILAKNIAVGTASTVLGILIQLAVALFLGMSAIECLAGFVQVFIAVIILCGIGNGISIMMPFRVNVGSLKPTKVPVKNVLMIMVITLMMPIFLLPALLGPIAGLLLGISGVVTGAVGNLMVSGALLLAVAVVYCLTLKPLGRLLAERELRILDTVTVEVE